MNVSKFCKICGAESGLKLTKSFQKKPVNYYECKNCGFLQAEDFDVSEVYNNCADESNFGWLERNRKILKIILLLAKIPFLKLFQGAKILDFGAGQGELVRYLRSEKYEAFGYEPYANDSEFLFSDPNNLPQKKFNLICCIEVLEHLKDPFDFFGLTKNFLDKNGYILISTEIYDKKEHDENWRYINPKAGHVSIFSKKAFGIFLGKNNFHIVFQISPALCLIRKNSGLFKNMFDSALLFFSRARIILKTFLKNKEKNDISKIKNPIFIVGCPRSGTTLLRLMLDSHSQIAIPDETGIFYFLYHYSGRQKNKGDKFLDELKNPSNLPRRALGQDVVDQAISKLKTQKKLFPKTIADSLFASFLGKQNKNIWGEKTPTHIFFIKDILKMYPGAGIIYIERDPRAVAASAKRYIKMKENAKEKPDFWMSEDVEKSALMWFDCHRSALKFKDKIWFIKYEELVRFPEKTLKNLFLNYLNLPYEERMMDYYQKAGEKIVIQQKKEIPQWHKAIAQNPDSENIDKWRRDLSPIEIYKIEALLKKYMRDSGYVLDNKIFPASLALPLLIKTNIYIIRNRVKLRLKFIKDYILSHGKRTAKTI